MASVTFTRHLYRYFPTLPREPVEVEAGTVAEVVGALEDAFPGIAAYLLDEAGAARKHVSIYVDSVLVRDRTDLSDPVGPTSEVFVAQALSGG